MLWQNVVLQHLDLCYNLIENGRAIALVQAFHANTYLVHLDLTGNPINEMVPMPRMGFYSIHGLVCLLFKQLFRQISKKTSFDNGVYFTSNFLHQFPYSLFLQISSRDMKNDIYALGLIHGLIVILMLKVYYKCKRFYKTVGIKGCVPNLLPFCFKLTTLWTA